MNRMNTVLGLALLVLMGLGACAPFEDNEINSSSLEIRGVKVQLQDGRLVFASLADLQLVHDWYAQHTSQLEELDDLEGFYSSYERFMDLSAQGAEGLIQAEEFRDVFIKEVIDGDEHWEAVVDDPVLSHIADENGAIQVLESVYIFRYAFVQIVPLQEYLTFDKESLASSSEYMKIPISRDDFIAKGNIPGAGCENKYTFNGTKYKVEGEIERRTSIFNSVINGWGRTKHHKRSLGVYWRSPADELSQSGYVCIGNDFNCYLIDKTMSNASEIEQLFYTCEACNPFFCGDYLRTHRAKKGGTWRSCNGQMPDSCN